jgi:hypothetical protein
MFKIEENTIRNVDILFDKDLKKMGYGYQEEE